MTEVNNWVKDSCPNVWSKRHESSKYCQYYNMQCCKYVMHVTKLKCVVTETSSPVFLALQACIDSYKVQQI